MAALIEGQWHELALEIAKPPVSTAVFWQQFVKAVFDFMEHTAVLFNPVSVTVINESVIKKLVAERYILFDIFI